MTTSAPHWDDFPLTCALTGAALDRSLSSLSANQVICALDRGWETGVYGVVQSLLRAHGNDTQTAGDRRYRDFRLRASVLHHELERVLSELSEAGPPALVLKGEVLGRLMYGAPYVRSYGDIDLLVRRADIAATASILQDIGFQAVQSAPDFHRNKAFPHIHPETGLLIDLHWTITYDQVPSPTTSELFERAQENNYSGFWVQTPSIEDTFLHLCLHFHAHVGFLKGLFDLAGWLDRYGDALDYEWIDATARRMGICGVIQWPLHTLHKLTGLDLPMLDVYASTAPRAWSQMSAMAVRGCLSSPSPISRASFLGIKADGFARGLRMLWKISSMTLLDHRTAVLQGALKPVFLGPDVIAQIHGRQKPLLRDYAHMFARPAVLAGKQLRDLWRGDHSDLSRYHRG